MPKVLQRGSIIRAVLNDHNGKSSEHFAVVLSDNTAIQNGGPLAVAGISTTIEDPLPSGWYWLNTHPEGDCVTGLREACVVKATWLDIVKIADVKEIRGRAPARIVKQLLTFVSGA